MKKGVFCFKSVLAALCATSLCISVIFPVNASAAQDDKTETGVNIIPSGNFDQDNSHWGIYRESGGAATYKIGGGKLTVKIMSPGVVSHAVQIYCDGFELLEGGRYTMSFDISSTVDRTVDWRLQVNGGDYHAYVEQTGVKVTDEVQTVEYDFTMEEGSDPAPRLCFNLGDQKKEQGLGDHEITIDNVSLVLTDDSSTQKVDTSTAEVGVNLNQLGYYPDDDKRAIIRDSSSDTSFEVVDVKTGKTVLEGKLKTGKNKGYSGETTSYGDFSKLKTPGRYFVHTEGNGDSFEFTIDKDPYREAFDAACRMLYLQRCGTDLDKKYAGDFAHEACHTEMATIYGDTKQIDVSGGWHDAGDYGRYASAAAKALADIMLAYEINPEAFTDDAGIPESGNGIPDILDEARYELDWLLKMQNSEGGVYHKVTGLNFDGIVMPQDCTEKLYVLPASKTATADFAGVMYLASRVYADVDKSFSDNCIKVAGKALEYYEKHIGERNFKNPSDVLTGEYADGNSSDEYLWALCEGFKTTGDSKQAEKIKSFDYDKLPEDVGLGWANMSGYAIYAYLSNETKPDISGYDYSGVLKECVDEFRDIALSESYGSSIKDDYPWGSNMTICNNGLLMLMAKNLLQDDSYLDAARMQFDYVCGANTTSYCFLTGYGALSPENPHHRPSQALSKAMPGMISGGPDSNLEDPFAKTVLADLPKAHRYFDSAQTYSCNEITIYWNSPFVFLMSYYMK